MKRILTFFAALALVLSVSAQRFAKPSMPTTSVAAGQTSAPASAERQKFPESTIQQFPYLLGAFYEELNSDLANYYVICSSVAGQYNATSGALTVPNGMALSIDFYAKPNAGRRLPSGTYSAGDGTQPLSYNSEFTYIIVTDANSNQKELIPITGPIEVSSQAGGQLVTTKFMYNGVEKTARFFGHLNFTTTAQTTDAYYQLTSDINTTFNGGISLYYGNLYEANTGNMVLRLYDCDFDPETGAQLSSGTAVELMLFNILFADPKEARIMPGHYTMARNFSADTWFPGMEINYMGINIAFGTFAQVLNREDPSFGDEGYAWSYAAGGTIDIEEVGSNLRISLDLISKTGHAIKGVYEGPQFNVLDFSDDKQHAVVSTLEQDLALSLDYVKHAEVYDNGEQAGNTRSFIVDLGSDWDVDKGDDRFILNETDHNPYGADCMRLEFLVDPKTAILPEGVYFVMAENYTNFFQAGRMRQGYFTKQGEITGTRWMHLAPGRYYVMDGHAPARSGSVSVQRLGCNEVGEDVYSFNINIVDDAGFKIVGNAAAPMRLHYKPADIDPAIVGVDNVIVNSHSDNSHVYDLLGRRIGQSGKGILLQGGRKVLR